MLIYNPNRQGQSQAPNSETISLNSLSLKGQQDWSLDSINTRWVKCIYQEILVIKTSKYVF